MRRTNFSHTIKKLLRVDTGYLLRSGGLITVSHIMGTACGFGVTVLLANFVDSTTYGQFKYIIAIVGILTAFSLTGAPSAILQFVAKGIDGAFLYEKNLTKRWGIPTLVLIGGVGAYYLIKDEFVLGFGVLLAGVISYFQSIYLLHTSFLNGKRDFKRLASNQIAAAFTNLLGIALAILFHLTSVLFIILAYNGSQLLYQMYASRKTFQAYALPEKVTPPGKKLSMHLSIGNSIGIVAEYIDKVLIFQFLGPYQLAVYAFAVGVPDQLRSMNKLIKAIAIPKLNVKNDSELIESVERHTRTYVVISFFIAAFFWLIATPLYGFFFPQYIEAARYASFYIIILPIIAFGMLPGEVLQVKHLVRSLYISRTVDFVSKGVLFVVLIPLFGITGAILSILISKALAMLSQAVLYLLWKRKAAGYYFYTTN